MYNRLLFFFWCVFRVGGFFLVLATNLKIFQDFLIFPTGDFFSYPNNGVTIDYEIFLFPPYLSNLLLVFIS